MASSSETDRAQRIIAAAYENAILGKGAANGSPEYGATIMMGQVAQFGPRTSTPIPPHNGYGDVNPKNEKICEIETHFKACLAEVLSTNNLRVEDALCMPLDLLTKLSRLVKGFNLTLSHFKSLAQRKIEETGGSVLTLDNVIAIEHDLLQNFYSRPSDRTSTSSPIWSSRNRPAFIRSDRIPSAYSAKQNYAITNSTASAPVTPISTTALTTAGPATSSPFGNNAADQTLALRTRTPASITSAKRALSPNTSPAPQRRPNRSSIGNYPSVFEIMDAAFTTTIDAVVGDAETQHEQKLNDINTKHQDELASMELEHKDQLKEQHRHLTETSLDNRRKTLASIRLLRTQYENLMEKKKALEKEKIKFEKDATDKKKAIEELQIFCNELSQEKDYAVQRSREISREKDDAVKRGDKLSGEKDQAVKHCDKVSKEKDQAVKHCGKLAEEKANAAKHNKELGTQMKNADKKILELEKDSKKLQKDLDDSKQSMQMLLSKIKTARRSLNATLDDAANFFKPK